MQSKYKISLEDTINVPPHNLDAEQMVIGAMLLESKYALSKIGDKIKPELFYKESNALIVESIIELYKTREQIDLLTVANHLKKRGKLDDVGGPYGLSQITNRLASAKSIESHLLIITEYHMRREIIAANGTSIHKAFDLSFDVFNIIGDQQTALQKITENVLVDQTENGYNVVDSALKEIQVTRTSEGLSGITSGFKDIDDLTMGWQNSNLIIIAARPGMGKTAFAMSMARKIVLKLKKKVGVVSLEMSKTELMKRLFSIDTQIKGKVIKGAKELTDQQLQRIALQSQHYAPDLLINDQSGINIIMLRSIIRRMIQAGAILIIVDYLQLLKGTKEYRGNRENEISEISRELKSIAKEFNVPIVALAQVSRETEKRKNKEPMLSDLRESGAIEQDADVVCFLHRPEYYGDEIDETGLSLIGVTQFIVAKQRTGALETVLIHFEKETTAFEDIGFTPTKEVDPF